MTDLTAEQLGICLAIAGIVISLLLAIRATKSKSQIQKSGESSVNIQSGRDTTIK